jgi:hypothetical protein
MFRQREGDLFCQVCGDPVSSEKRWRVEQHCFGQGKNYDDWVALAPEAKQKLRHYTKLLAWQTRSERLNKLEVAMRLNMRRYGPSMVERRAPLGQHCRRRLPPTVPTCCS